MQSHSERLPEERIKAAYLYNFITLTNWPGEIGKDINLCIYTGDSYDELLQELNGEKAGNRRIKLMTLSEDKLHLCHVLFMSHKTVEKFNGMIIKKLHNQAVLTVSDTPGALDKGFIIGLEKQGNRVVFVVNQGAALRNRLTLSSKLLRMAVRISP